MLTEQEKRRLQTQKTQILYKGTYPNILDAVAYYCGFSGIAKEEAPTQVTTSLNLFYLDRLESFLKDEIDLPSFYAFVEGRTGPFTVLTGYPMATIAMDFIIESVQGGMGHEDKYHFHNRSSHHTLPM